MSYQHQFMVTFVFPETPTTDLATILPLQQAAIEQFFTEGLMIHFAVCEEKGKAWGIFSANSEYEIMQRIAEMPMSAHFAIDIDLLDTTRSMELTMPTFSSN